ncbi:hypothetical protein HDR61_01720 [bacterium]|nr:hypothetical protein [bacterium]
MKKEQPQMVSVRHTPRQRLIGIVALAVLFGCGIMVGMSINGNGGAADPAMDKQCAALSKQIISISSKSYMGTDDLERLEKFNDAYAKNCADYNFMEEPKPQPKVEDTADKKTCEVIEELLSERLNVPVMTGSEIAMHSNNIAVYKSLVEKGCPENADKYSDMIMRESAIIDALKSNASSENTRTCTEIEHLLMQNTYPCETDAECHINNAKVYANISERGCPENRQKYVDLAAKELEIARALQDDNFSDSDREQISDTYRRIQMKQTANEIMNKVQKLADPAIDFIIQAQKIIEE